MGATVAGISDKVPTTPSKYELLRNIFSEDLRVDVADSRAVLNTVLDFQPDYLFHLAGQSIVFDSYERPLETFQTNAIGTANVLDALRLLSYPCSAVIVTSDKCYDNVEWVYGYRETDRLGGKDPYSGSKGAAELVVRAYVESYFKSPGANVRVAIARAGNVIGGGDWAPHRIVPDCIRSWSKDKTSDIRSPLATRPWQHVLEPLSGYLLLASRLSDDGKSNGEAFNFGPLPHYNHTVGELVDEVIKEWPGSRWKIYSGDTNPVYEANLLKLNCDKARHILGWSPTLGFEETARWTGKWYYTFYQNGPTAALHMTYDQIRTYERFMKDRASCGVR